jgi:hypothetical protein
MRGMGYAHSALQAGGLISAGYGAQFVVGVRETAGLKMAD